VAAMHVLSPANLFQTDAAAAGKARSPMVAHTVRGVWGEVTRFQVLMDSTFIRFISHKCTFRKVLPFGLPHNSKNVRD